MGSTGLVKGSFLSWLAVITLAVRYVAPEQQLHIRKRRGLASGATSDVVGSWLSGSEADIDVGGL